MGKTRHFVRKILPGSIAQEMDIQAGDEVLSINGSPIEDIFDYQFLIQDENIDLLLRKPDKADIYGYSQKSFLIGSECPRFGSGEAKGRILESVRGVDLFILVDVCNYSITYKVCGLENHMSPDDHYQDLKRIIAAAIGKAHRINVIMPFLYEGRQH